jgi:hypothetical protein
MKVGDRVIVAGANGWPDNPGTVEEIAYSGGKGQDVAGPDVIVRLDDKHSDGTPFDGWPWCLAWPCRGCGKVHFIEQAAPIGMSPEREAAIVEKLKRGENIADMWPLKC